MNDSPELRFLVYSGLQRSGVDVAAIGRRLGYEATSCIDLWFRFPHAQQADFWLAAESITGNPEIGLQICARMPRLRGGMLAYAMLSCPTYAEGLDVVCRSSRLLSDALRLAVLRADGVNPVLSVKASDSVAPQMRHTEICMAFALIGFLRAVTDEAFRPKSIKFGCPHLGALRDYESVFECDVEFGRGPTEIEFDRTLLALRSPHHVPEIWDAHRKEVGRRLLELQRQDLEDRVRRVLVAHLPNRRCSFDDVAAELQIPNRTLRLKLEAIGTTFSDLQEGECLRIAKRLLRRERGRLEDIAEASGYSQRSALCRAFKRSTGLTPTEYRASRSAARGSRRAEPFHGAEPVAAHSIGGAG